MEGIEIRKLNSLPDFEKCVAIQKEVWRHEEIDLTPVHHFCISGLIGGILLGAFLEEEMIGFVYSFPAMHGRKLCQHSHLMAVLPACQGFGVGKKLKWAQRHRALRLGYDLITWTYDPLKARNSNLNLHILGALAGTYLRNFYGLTPSLVLGPGIPTDRVLVEWPIRQKRVEDRKKGRLSSLDPDVFPKALEGETRRDGLISPLRPVLSLGEKLILVEIPRNIEELRKEPRVVSRWQKALRKTMEHYFSCGYSAVDFISGGRCYYVLEKG